MLNHRFIFITILFIVFISSFAFGMESDKGTDYDNKTEAVLLRIKQAASKIETLEGEFIQKKKISILKDMPDSYGRFYYQSPDRLRWEIVKPVTMGFIINGDHGRKWNGKEGKSRRFDVSKDPIISVISTQVFAWAKGDFEKLKTGYDVSILSEDPVEVKLLPLSEMEKKYIDSIVLAFSENDYHINNIEINDKKGGSTKITFYNMVVNAGIEGDIF